MPTFCLPDIARNINGRHSVQSMFKRSVQQQLLSYHYRNKSAKSSKLNLFGKAIAVIDRLQEPQSLANIQELDLSHNGISEIQNIEQFASVEFINLSHNRIVDHEEILKLQKLARLDTLFLKGNPFLREKMDRKVIAFLLSLNTDVQILSAETSRLVNTLATKTLQNLSYAHYLRRIENHIELMNNYQVDDGFLSPDYAIFPKIKKIFEENTKELSIKRQIIEAIEERCFEDEGIVAEYMKNRLEAAENERSEIIRKIYQRQQLLRNVRATYKQRVMPKKVIPRAMNGTVVVGYFSPPRLKESRKQAKVQDRMSATKPRIRRDDMENSPPRRLSESIEWREGNQEKAVMNHLIKMNPLYHLLHSPLPSLKSHEKELLIQSLTLHLKEKLKEMQKLQKKQYEYNKTKAEMNDLQEHLREMSVEFKNEQTKSQEKLKKISTVCKEQSQRVQNLCNQLTTCQEQLQSLKVQNGRIRDQNTQLKQKLALYQSQEDLQEAIKDHFSRSLKQKYIKLLSKKAHHLSQLKILRCINQKNQQRQLKEKYFTQMVVSSQLSKHQKLLIQVRKNKLFKELINQIRSNQTLTIKQETFLRKIYRSSQRHLLNNLQQNHMKVMTNKEMIKKFKKDTGYQIKAKVFNVFKQLLEEKYQERYNESVEKQSGNIKLRKALKIWKIFIAQHEKRMAECYAQVKRGCKRYYFNKFTQKCRADLLFLASTHASSQFLQKMRKIKSYFNFSKSTSSTILQRRLKSRKVSLIRQHQYLFWFISTIRDGRVKKRMLIQRELQQKRWSEEEKRMQENAEKGVKDSKKLVFANVLGKTGSKIVTKILIRYKASMVFQKQRQQGSVKGFLGKLRTNWIEEYKLSTKIMLLRKSPIIAGKLKDFFICLSSIKTKIQAFHCKSSGDKLLKCFYRWKFYNSWSKMQQYKQLYQELGPEISHVSQLQREVGRQRELLMLQMEEKERMVRDWQRKCEEYEYILHSKDMKYQKLKHIYADMVSQQEMKATVKKIQEKESDTYLKYLPSELKIQPTTKYNFQGNTQQYLKGRTPSQLDTFKPDVVRQASAYLKNRQSFLSSFKRF